MTSKHGAWSVGQGVSSKFILGQVLVLAFVAALLLPGCDKSPPKLTIETDPPGASVTVAGRVISGTTPVTVELSDSDVTRTQIGDSYVPGVAQKPGYLPSDFRLDLGGVRKGKLERGKTYLVSVQLRPE